MQPIVIASSFAELDGEVRYREGLSASGVAIPPEAHTVTLTISPLGDGWETPLPEGHFRCGSGPVDALERAVALLRGGEAEWVRIVGEDPLRTGYGRDERVEAMAIYPGVASVAHGYDLLARRFLAYRGIDRSRFANLRDALFENYLRSYRDGAGANVRAPGPGWYEPVTELFRGVDCANPVVDFKGELVLTTARAAQRLDGAETRVELAGVGIGALELDGPEAVDEIARFDHLREAVTRAEAAAGVRIADAFLGGDALLEVYTCFPVIPLAFLLEAKIAPPEELEALLAAHPVTLTGGMNLARAPWNNPALHALVAMHQKLLEGPAPLGVVHGNGGLGFRQGVAILRRRGV